MKRPKPVVCYLTATVTKLGFHLAFCGRTFVYGEETERYRVANYADPIEVTCVNCLTWWRRTYPDRAAEFDARWPRPVTYQVPEGEHPDVQLLRDAHAGLIRTYVRLYGTDDTIPDVDFAYGLHAFTYALAKELAAFSLKVHGPDDQPESI